MNTIVFYLYSTSNHNPIGTDTFHRPLYSIFILHQTTTLFNLILSTFQLYSIFILHQTTTRKYIRTFLINCILSLFYIKPQHPHIGHDEERNCILSLFYIKPQQPKYLYIYSCIVFYLYSTSNHNLIE